MTDVVQSLFGSQASDIINKFSSAVGVDSSKGGDIISFAAPLVMGGLAGHGEQQIGKLLDQHSGGGLLDNLGPLFDGVSTGSSSGLAGIAESFGANALVGQLTEKFGIGKEMAETAVPMVTSLVLSALAAKRDSSTGGLSSVTALLDQNGTGSVLDDVMGLFSGNNRKDSGGLGGLVDGLFGGK